MLRDETASEIRVEYEEFKTDVTALFLAVSFGNVALVKMLLVSFFFPQNLKPSNNTTFTNPSVLHLRIFFSYISLTIKLTLLFPIFRNSKFGHFFFFIINK